MARVNIEGNDRELEDMLESVDPNAALVLQERAIQRAVDRGLTLEQARALYASQEDS